MRREVTQPAPRGGAGSPQRIAVRQNTSVAGVTSRTATRIIRYGHPRSRTSPRRAPSPAHCAVVDRCSESAGLGALRGDVHLGVPYLMIRVAVREVTPATLVFWRTAIAAAILLCLPAARRGLRDLAPHWKALAVFAAIEITLPWLLLARAEEHLTSSMTGLLVAAVPLIGAVVILFTEVTSGSAAAGSSVS